MSFFAGMIIRLCDSAPPRMGNMKMLRCKRDITCRPTTSCLSCWLPWPGPLIILGFNSLKAPAEIGRNPLGPPTELVWQNYSRGVGHGQLLHDDA